MDIESGGESTATAEKRRENLRFSYLAHIGRGFFVPFFGLSAHSAEPLCGILWRFYSFQATYTAPRNAAPYGHPGAHSTTAILITIRILLSCGEALHFSVIKRDEPCEKTD